MTDAEVAFHATLDLAPQDWATRRAYAEWLEGDGRLAEARFQRWLAAECYAPTTGASWLYHASGWAPQWHWPRLGRSWAPGGPPGFWPSRRAAEAAFFEELYCAQSATA